MIMVSAAILALCVVRTAKEPKTGAAKDQPAAEPAIGLFGSFFSEAKLTVPLKNEWLIDLFI